MTSSTSRTSVTSALSTAKQLLTASNADRHPDRDKHFERLAELEVEVLFGGPPASNLDQAQARLEYVRLRERHGDPMMPEDYNALVDALEADLEHLRAVDSVVAPNNTHSQ